MARSLLDGIECLEYEHIEAYEREFFAKLIEFILGNQLARQSFIAARSILLFINDAAKVFVHFKEQSAPLVSYIVDVFTGHEKLRQTAVDTLCELSLYCKSHFSTDVVTALHTFLSNSYASIRVEHGRKIVQSLVTIISAIDSGNLTSNLR